MKTNDPIDNEVDEIFGKQEKDLNKTSVFIGIAVVALLILGILAYCFSGSIVANDVKQLQEIRHQ